MNPQTPNRRDAIQAGLGALALAGCGTTRNLASGWIDAHSHIWTNDAEDLKKFPLATGRTADDLNPARFTAENLINLGKTQGVHRHVIISHRHYHGYPQLPRLWMSVERLWVAAAVLPQLARYRRQGHLRGRRQCFPDPPLRGPADRRRPRQLCAAPRPPSVPERSGRPVTLLWPQKQKSHFKEY